MQFVYQDGNQDVANVRARLDRELSVIRQRKDITEDARRVAIARAYTNARDTLDRVRERDIASFQKRRTSLERRLFGNVSEIGGASAIASRDARDRAAKYDDAEQALAAFRRAERDGDRDMMRALAAHAADLSSNDLTHKTGSPWTVVVQEWAQGSPGRSEALKELSGLSDPSSGLDMSYVLATPTEMGRMADSHIRDLAHSDLTVHGPGPEAA